MGFLSNLGGGANKRILIGGRLVKWRILKTSEGNSWSLRGVTHCYKLSILGSFVMLEYCWDTHLHGVLVKVLL